MQAQSRLAEQMSNLERERHNAERVSWHAQTHALLHRDLDVLGTNKKRMLDLDVGYHQELEASNKRLEMDNRLMAPRVSRWKIVTDDSLLIRKNRSINW
jgi:hypothetical protein